MEFETPAPGAPEGQPEQPVQPEAATEPEYLELKNRDESWRVQKDLAQQFADQMGWDVNRLKDTLEIGSDGRQLYSRIDEERDRARREYEAAAQARMQYEQAMAQRQQPQYGAQYPQYREAPQQRGYSPRPPAQDVTGNVIWAAEMLERLSPYLERIPEIERSQGYINQSIAARDEARENAEERAIAMRAYQETADMWQKEYGMAPPSQRELEAYLRTVTISDDVNKSWGDIWNEAAWALSGPRAFRQARRQAVIAAQQPGATIVAPTNRASASAAPQPVIGNGLGPNPTQEELDAQFNQMAQMLQRGGQR